MKENKLFATEPIQNRRQTNVDLLKAISVLFMVLCHTVIYVSEEYESPLYAFANDWIGSYLGVAHAFMLCMGIGMAFSKDNSPRKLIVRGIKLVLLGYLLNFLRSGIFVLIEYGFSTEFVYYFLLHDILAFAGLANLIMGVLLKLRLKPIHIFLLSVVLSIVGSFVYNVECGSFFSNYLVGFFVNTGAAESKEEPDFYTCFVFLSWFVFPALGYFLGNLIRRCKDLPKLYSICTIAGGFVGFAYLLTVGLSGIPYLNFLCSDYAISALDAIGYIGIDLFLLGIFFFLSEKVPAKVLAFPVLTSKNVLIIYFTHWIVVSAIGITVGSVLETTLPFSVLYPLGLLVWFACSLLSVPIRKILPAKKKRNGPEKTGM